MQYITIYILTHFHSDTEMRAIITSLVNFQVDINILLLVCK